MQHNIQIFTSEEFGKVRVIQKDGQPWWVLKDICAALGLSDARRVAERLDDDELSGVRLHSGGQMRNMYAVSESGVYAVILRSDKPQARKFRRWLTSDVIPAIRQYGAYATPETLDSMQQDSEFTAGLICNLAKTYAKNRVLMDQVEALTPKALYCDMILQCDHSVPVTLIAKAYGMTAQAFNKLLHDLGVQYRLGSVWHLYKGHADKGYTVSKTYYVGRKQVSIHTAWTQSGRFWLYDLLKWHGILPVMERQEAA